MIFIFITLKPPAFSHIYYKILTVKVVF